MATSLGINNPNSRYNRFLRTSEFSLPLTRQAEIRVTLDTIRAVETLRSYHYSVGNFNGARLQAVRIGCLRRELRQMRGMS